MTTTSAKRTTGPKFSADCPEWMQHIARYVEQMDYGQITLTIHQGKVVEIQRTERTRLVTKKETD